MKAKDFATKYNVELSAFEQWLPKSGYSHSEGFWGVLDVDEKQNLEEIARSFKQNHADEQERISREKIEQERAAQEKQAGLASMFITSGFSFDGYSITKYSGYISGDDAVQVARGTDGFFSQATDTGAALMKSLAVIRRNALAELKESAYDLGCNAVIGVDFDYLTLDPETANANGGTTYLPYVFGVTANGNAVIIEKK
jgi:uncharacterized protein YbjQ (UPF0145 family)